METCHIISQKKQKIFSFFVEWRKSLCNLFHIIARGISTAVCGGVEGNFIINELGGGPNHFLG